MELWRRREAGCPLLIDVPHAGTYVPPAIQERMEPLAARLPDTDWHVDRLFAFAEELGAGLLAATHSRYVIDLNRDPMGVELYPEADNTELAPLTRFDWGPIYRQGQEPDADECLERVETYWQPYHDRLQADVDAVKSRFGYCILLDGHSIPHQVPRFFEGRLPDLNLGTNLGKSAAPPLIEAAWRAISAQPRFSRVHDGRFTGGYVTRHYGSPGQHAHALQIEIVQSAYMDEAKPTLFDEAKAKDMSDLLATMARALLSVKL